MNNIDTKARGNFIGGDFQKVLNPDGEIRSFNPSDKKTILGTFPYSLDSVDLAIGAANQSFPLWSKSAPGERWIYLDRLSQQIEKNKENLARVISLEIGKPYWEALHEVQSVIGKFRITKDKSMLLVKDFSVKMANDFLKGECRFKPRGVLAVIAPFNFPLHLAMGHIIPALACGNTIVLKPSEFAPLISQFLAEMFQMANFPNGVFNLIQGDASIGKKLCEAPIVKGVLFTGSYATGQSIAKNLISYPHKILVLEMGGKNTSLIWKDAALEQAVSSILQSATITTGQRCSCTSKLFVHKTIWPQIENLLKEITGHIQVGDPFQENVFMGPLISENSMHRFHQILTSAEQNGARVLEIKRKRSLSKKGYFVAPQIHFLEDLNKNLEYIDEEIFGPDLAVYLYDGLDDAFEKIEASKYGLATSIFCRDKQVFENAFREITSGVINWNRPTTGASSALPFGGQKASGNDFPTALFAPYYCTYPVAHLADES